MNSKEKFYTSIQEITFLNQKIGNNSEDKALFKSIVLLLSAKLEKYVKDSTRVCSRTFKIKSNKK